MKVSVIMPTFNSTKYIKASLGSLETQAFKEFEVVAVDSGSTDGTIDILKAYKKNGLTMRIVSTPDCSPAVARNVGIENASGEYVAFCDSDDIMKPDMLKSIYKTAVTDNADIAVCDFDMVYPEKTIESFAHLSNKKFELSKDNVVDYYYRFCAAPKPNNYVWARLFKRGFIVGNDLTFPNTRYSEDHLFNLSALFKNPIIAHVAQSLYCYVQHDDSAMRRHIRQTNHGLLFLECFRNAIKELEGKDLIVSMPILAIYAYTRIKSIIFYAWQAMLPETEMLKAVSVFASDSEVKKYLSFCVERDYIGDYCRLHGFSNKWKNKVCAIIGSCVEGTALPNMSEVFA